MKKYFKGENLCFPMNPQNHIKLVQKCFVCYNAQFFCFEKIFTFSNTSNILAKKKLEEKC